MIGEVVGSYRLTGELGEGGMGKVYDAEHTLIGRTAAVKMLLPQFSSNKEIVGRFFNEAKAATAIQHPGIVEIFDFGYHTDGSAFIVMERLRGESLAARLRRAPRMPTDKALTIARQIGSALGAAHDQGIIHRDLKPDNVFLVPDPEVPGGERVKVLDFGIAKLGEEQDSSVKTRTGAIMGTPAYMSPEQCRGSGGVDHRADLYALGCILYEMLLARTPFYGEGTGEVLAAQIYAPLPPPREVDPSLPAPIEALLLKLLAKGVDDRFASADEVVAALSAGGIAPDGAVAGAVAPTQMLAPGAASPEQSTTLSTAASQVSSSTATAMSRPRWPLAAAAVLVAAAAVIAVIVFGGLGGGTSSDDGEVAAAPAEDPEPPADDELSEDDAEDPVADDADDPAADDVEEPPVPTEPATVRVAVASKPKGAAVYRKSDGVRVGVTPYETELEATEGTIEFLVKRRGYVDATVALSALEGGQETVVLERKRRRPGSGRPARPPAGTRPATPDPQKDPIEPPLDDEAYNPFAD